VAACESTVCSIRAAFAQPGALERTLHHTIGDMPGRQLLVQLVADCVVHSWDLATVIGVDPGLDEQLIELSYEFYLPLMQKDAVYATAGLSRPRAPSPKGPPRWSGSCISWAADSLSLQPSANGPAGLSGLQGPRFPRSCRFRAPVQSASRIDQALTVSSASGWPAGIPG
jgi:hypothetical protein